MPRGLLLGPGGELEALELLGEGGMGTVHAARDRVLERTVALKRPKGAGSANAALIAEARTLAQMDHPNVVPVHALGLDEHGNAAVVMKRIQGRRWIDLAVESPNLERDVEIALEVADALRFAHARGVLHRDLKPDNVMVGDFGEVYLMDWGCACPLTGAVTGEVCGTPTYMAPEMLEPGAALGPATDVFLLGATLHRVLTGRPRHVGRDLREVLAAAWRCPPVQYPAPFPHELGVMLNRATARHPADRYASVETFAAALRAFRGHREAAALADASLATLPALDAAMEAGDPRADSLYAELRLGVHTALRGWPEHPCARADLASATERFIAWKLSIGEPAAAEGVLGEVLDGARAAWSARIEAVREAQRVREAEARANDLGIAAQERTRAAWIVAVSTVVLAPLALALRGTRTFSPTEVLVSGLASLGLVALAVLPFRKALLVNRASRTLMLGIVLLVSAAAAHRTLAWLADDAAASTLRSESVWMFGGLCILALGGESGIAIAGVPYLAASIAMVFLPDLAGFLFPFAALPSAAITLLVFRRRVRAS